MKKYIIYIIVMISGASVLALEILGTRILGPFYGVSLYLWSALITVTLAALSFGYYIGGILADKNPSLSRLSLFCIIAGIWITIIPFIKYPFLTLSEPLGLRVAVVLSAFVLFFPPLTVLGMISPYAIKLRANDLSEVGRTAGNLYALSTIAGVCSALLTGFILIPNIGVNRLTMIVGICLILTAILGFIVQKKYYIQTGLLVVLVILSYILLWNRYQQKPDVKNGLMAVEQSAYGELRVIDNENGRHLLIDGGIHSIVDETTKESFAHYVAVMDLPKYFFDKPERMLLIGLGGGSLMKQYANAGWKVDAVEIDNKVIKLAYEFFDLQTSEGTVHEVDGRQFLKNTKDSYDVILLDAFGSSSIPFHLVTKEAFDLINSRLTKNGILAVNIETIGWDDPIVSTLYITLKQVYEHVLALPMEEPPNQFGNVVLLASHRQLIPSREPEYNVTYDPEWRFGPGYQKYHAWENRFEPAISKVQILTDDLNSIDIRSEEINLASRKLLHNYFGKDGLSW